MTASLSGQQLSGSSRALASPCTSVFLLAASLQEPKNKSIPGEGLKEYEDASHTSLTIGVGEGLLCHLVSFVYV